MVDFLFSVLFSIEDRYSLGNDNFAIAVNHSYVATYTALFIYMKHRHGVIIRRL